jgi:hypothetical protein
LALIWTFHLSEWPEALLDFGPHLSFLPVRVYRDFARTLALIRAFYISKCTETLRELWHSFEVFTSQNVQKLCPNFGTHSNFLPLRKCTAQNVPNFARTLALSRTLPLRMYQTLPELGTHSNFTSQNVPKLCPNFGTQSSFLPLSMCRNFAQTLALIQTFTSQYVQKLCPNFGTHSNLYLSVCTETLPELWHSFELFTSQNAQKETLP